MKSIRLSLLVYFLGLLGLALGAVSLYVYRTIQATLADKNEATAKLIQKQYEELCAKERARLDEALLAEARAMTHRRQIYADPRVNQTLAFEDGRRRVAATAGLLATGPVPNGHVAGALGATEGLNAVVGLPRWPVAEIRLDENELSAEEPPDHDRRVLDHLQIQAIFPFPAAFRSPSLDGLTLSLPQDMAPGQEYGGPEYCSVELEPGVTVRRVLFRSHVKIIHPPGNGAASLVEGRPPRSGDKPFPRGSGGTWVTVLAAYGPDRLADAYAPLQQQRDEEKARLEERTDESLTRLRNRLLAVSLTTFALVVVGVYFLVLLGLLPLQRLGDAVSKVSERDFRLHFEEPRLPTELVPIVDHLRHTLDELRGAFEREKQAAADISHELRTPVAALLTTISVALKKPRKPEDYRQALEDCRESGQQISQLVERLLTLARLDAGVDRLRVEKVDVAALAEQCTSLVRPLAEARGLTLRLRSEGEAVLEADPGKLREVLTNLLHNAIEYNRPDGSVDLSVVRHNGTLCVEVRDTGVGISPEARARIFERFYRADPSRQAEGLHAGLGLAIVKGYVDLMGGSIQVESAEGCGSTFRVELPADGVSKNG